jgi:hypothetical protein
MKFYIPDHGEKAEDAEEIKGNTEDDPRWFAQNAADYCHLTRDGREWSWPIKMVVIDDQDKEHLFEFACIDRTSFGESEEIKEPGEYPMTPLTKALLWLTLILLLSGFGYWHNTRPRPYERPPARTQAEQVKVDRTLKMKIGHVAVMDTARGIYLDLGHGRKRWVVKRRG